MNWPNSLASKVLLLRGWNKAKTGLRLSRRQRACIVFASRYAHVLSFTPSYFLACSKGAKVVNEGETRAFLALFHPLSLSILTSSNRRGKVGGTLNILSSRRGRVGGTYRFNTIPSEFRFKSTVRGELIVVGIYDRRTHPSKAGRSSSIH